MSQKMAQTNLHLAFNLESSRRHPALEESFIFLTK